jgi:hypothetical protein
MRQEYSCSALLIGAERKVVLKNVEVNGKKTFKIINTIYFKLTVHNFLKKFVIKNEAIITLLVICTHHYNKIREILKSRIKKNSLKLIFCCSFWGH